MTGKAADEPNGVAKETIAKEMKQPPRRWPWMVGFFTLLGLGAVLCALAYEADRTQASQLAAAQLKVIEIEQQRKKSDGEKTDLEQRVAALEAEKSALSKDVAAKSEELEKLKGTYDKLQEKMKDEIAKGDIRLSQDKENLRVDMVDKILFNSGEAVIAPRGEAVLARVGAILASVNARQIEVSGHTDGEPISKILVDKFPTNWELSAARALNVVRFLEEKAGVPGKRLVASANGPYRPIASNSTPEGRARNRRIEILLTPVLAVSGKIEPTQLEAAAPAAKPTPKASPEKPAGIGKPKTVLKGPKAK